MPPSARTPFILVLGCDAPSVLACQGRAHHGRHVVVRADTVLEAERIVIESPPDVIVIGAAVLGDEAERSTVLERVRARDAIVIAVTEPDAPVEHELIDEWMPAPLDADDFERRLPPLIRLLDARREQTRDDDPA